MRFALVALALVPLVAACGVKQDAHDSVVAQLAETRLQLAACTATTQAWKKVPVTMSDLTANFVEVWAIAKANAGDCSKLGAALDAHVAKGQLLAAMKGLGEAEAALGKNALDEAGTKWEATMRLVGADIDAVAGSLQKACPAEAGAIGQKFATALKGEGPAPAAAAK